MFLSLMSLVQHIVKAAHSSDQGQPLGGIITSESWQPFEGEKGFCNQCSYFLGYKLNYK